MIKRSGWRIVTPFFILFLKKKSRLFLFVRKVVYICLTKPEQPTTGKQGRR